MRGEVDFRGALMERVALLGGLAEGVLAECRMDRVRLTRGARTLVQTMKAYGAHSVLVTGGFTAFANPVGEAIGFDRVVANERSEEHTSELQSLMRISSAVFCL